MKSGELLLRRVQSAHSVVVTSQLRTSGREHLILGYRDGERWVEGEASPLPGFGRDDIDWAHRCLSALRPQAIELAVALLVDHFHRGEPCLDAQLWSELTELFECESPSARFCWEMLCARAAAEHLGVSLFQLLCKRPRQRMLATSQVLDPLSIGFLQRAQDFWLQGVRTFKIKCGRSLHEEVDAIAQLCSLLDQPTERLSLRIDANRGFDTDSARELIATLRDAPIQWYEDLTPDPSAWKILRNDVNLFAVDEPLVERGAEAAASADVLIIKPMALGGFSSSLALCSFAAQNAKEVCVSHLFDGALAFEATAALAFCVQTATGAAGLSLHAGLEGHANARFSWLFCDRMIVPNNS